MWLLFCHDSGRMKQNQNHEASRGYSIHSQQNLKIQLLKKVPRTDRAGKDWEKHEDRPCKRHETLTEIAEGLLKLFTPSF